MTSFYNSISDAYLGYAAIFVCIGVGFLFVRKVSGNEIGPGYWALSFFLGSVGFLFWSGSLPLSPPIFFTVGEMFHMLGFLALVCGAYRFTGHKFHRWNIYALVGLIAVWVGALLLGSHSRYVSGLLLKALRAILFLWAGFMILRRIPAKSLEGRTLTSWSLICWGIHLLVFSVIHLPKLVDLAFGFLVGLQVLSALGMVVMVVDRMRLRAEDSESRVRRIEGLLPICSFCKRIRDENNSWHSMETYVREHSDTEFSHGLCPDCAKLHYSEYYEETEGKKP